MAGFDYLHLKMPLILVISVFMSSLNFLPSRVEHEISFITSVAGFPRSTQTQNSLITLTETNYIEEQKFN